MMRRQGVHHYNIIPGKRQKSSIHLVIRKYLSPLLSLRFLSHTRPDISINHISLIHHWAWIFHTFYVAPLASALLFAIFRMLS